MIPTVPRRTSVALKKAPGMQQWLGSKLGATPQRRRLAAGIAVTAIAHSLLLVAFLSMKSTLKPLPSTPVIQIMLEDWDVRESLPVARPIIQESRMVTREDLPEGVLDLHEAKIILPEAETHPLTDSTNEEEGGVAPPAGTGSGPGQGDYWPPGLSPVQEALNFGNYCRGQQSRGETPHPSCGLTDLASLPTLGPRDPDGVMARKDRETRYRNSPGNADYWKRVVRSPSPSLLA